MQGIISIISIVFSIVVVFTIFDIHKETKYLIENQKKILKHLGIDFEDLKYSPKRFEINEEENKNSPE